MSIYLGGWEQGAVLRQEMRVTQELEQLQNLIIEFQGGKGC